MIEGPKGLGLLVDDSIVGNSEKMIFYSKEFAATGEDPSTNYNPYVVTQLDLKSIENFNFDIIESQFKETLEKSERSDFNKRKKLA